jgi:rSAM/selenodomain-associated transferase 2
MTLLISVIVPVLDDTAVLGRLLSTLPPEEDVEVIVVDGGGDPALEPMLASRPDVRLVRTAAGRGHQMNAGAAQARGDWLLFLHADSTLPSAWIDPIRSADREPSVIGGWFRFRLDAARWQARVIERLAAARVRLFHLPYGDQGLFVRRSTFTDLGGYRALPLMEDVEFVRRLVRAGRVRPSPLPLTTSARRWERDGWFRRSGRNLALICGYFAGVSPHRLARWYGTRGS